MLSRIARQRNAASHLRVSNGRLVSPSLATLRFHSHLGRPNFFVNTSVNPSPDRLRQTSLQSNRHLATAADHSPVEQQPPYPSFENSSYTAGHRYDQPAQMASLFPPIPKGLNASSLIIIDDLLQTRPRALKKHKGIGGDEDEMMANLDISLKVGRMDRAANLITRLGEYFPIGSPEYLAIHNRYLEEMVSHMVVTRQQNLVLPLQRWFEVDMAHGGVQPDARTYAIMIRMALRMLHGAKRDRAVRRYWSFAKTAGVEEEVLAVPVLSELELGELSEVCLSHPCFHFNVMRYAEKELTLTHFFLFTRSVHLTFDVLRSVVYTQTLPIQVPNRSQMRSRL